jgi:hypothetical protein
MSRIVLDHTLYIIRFIDQGKGDNHLWAPEGEAE